MHNNTGTYTNTDYANEAKNDVPAISRQMSLVQKLLAEHREIQEIIGQRLNAVLKPSPPQGAEAVPFNSPQPAPSPMERDLIDFVATLQRTLAGYHDILNRLEL